METRDGRNGRHVTEEAVEVAEKVREGGGGGGPTCPLVRVTHVDGTVQWVEIERRGRDAGPPRGTGESRRSESGGSGGKVYIPARRVVRPVVRPAWEVEEEDRVREWPMTEDVDGADGQDAWGGYGDASRDGVECRSGDRAYSWWVTREEEG